jgi:hypothetical protein
MRNLFNSRKRIAVVAAGAAVLIGGVTAVAYWTTTGAGSGSGTVASANGTVGLSASFPTVGLYPGGSVVVSYKATNANATDLKIGTISSVVSIDSPHATNGCLASWFSVADVFANQVIAHGTAAPGVAVTATGSLVFANDGANQDACQGASVTLTLSATTVQGS